MPQFREPELKPAADRLSKEIKEICKNGSGKIRFGEIITLFPGFPPQLKPEVESRGDIIFNDSGFENKGESKVIQYPMKLKGMNTTLKINIPQLLRGKYKCTDNGFDLAFNPGETIKASIKIGFFEPSTDLRGIQVTDSAIFIKTLDKKTDLTIDLI